MKRLGIVALLLLLGCEAGESAGPEFEDWTFTGTWRGGFIDGYIHMSAVFHLTEQDTVLAGTGHISGSGLQCEVAIDGYRQGEQVRLFINCPGYETIRYRGGREAATRISGYVLGSGIPPNDMDLIKQ